MTLFAQHPSHKEFLGCGALLRMPPAVKNTGVLSFSDMAIFRVPPGTALLSRLTKLVPDRRRVATSRWPWIKYGFVGHVLLHVKSQPYFGWIDGNNFAAQVELQKIERRLWHVGLRHFLGIVAVEHRKKAFTATQAPFLSFIDGRTWSKPSGLKCISAPTLSQRR